MEDVIRKYRGSCQSRWPLLSSWSTCLWRGGIRTCWWTAFSSCCSRGDGNVLVFGKYTARTAFPCYLANLTRGRPVQYHTTVICFVCTWYQCSTCHYLQRGFPVSITFAIVSSPETLSLAPARVDKDLWRLGGSSTSPSSPSTFATWVLYVLSVSLQLAPSSTVLKGMLIFQPVYLAQVLVWISNFFLIFSAWWEGRDESCQKTRSELVVWLIYLGRGELIIATN